LLDGATHSAAPPEAFWKLPATATSASFDHGGDPKRYARIQRTLAELVGGFLEHEKAPARTVQRVVELVETAPLLGRAAVYAEGDLPASVPRPTDAAQRARYDFGWRWIGFAEPPASLRRWLDGLTAASADRALRRLVEERFNLVTGALPSVKRRPARGMAPGSTTYEIALPAGLAAGGGMLQTLFKTPDLAGAKAGGKPAQRPVSVVLVLVPDGDRTWLGAAGDEASLAAPLRAIRQGADQDRLARREGLEWLRPLSAASGGFLTLRSFAGGLASLAGAGEPNHASARDVRGVLDTLPHRAQAPAPYATTMTRERGLQAAWTVRLPKAVLTDMAALLPAMIALGGSPPPTVP
jgi:hypothetical protein